jgi:parallel beta-helix repeat protein
LFRKTVSGILLFLLLISTLTVAFNIQPTKASGTIYIRADGSVEPPDAPISSIDNVTYTFTADIYDEIVVERDNITVDGAGYTLNGAALVGYPAGMDLSGRTNVAVRNTQIKNFWIGIWLNESSNNNISGNNITNNNSYGICLWYSSNNSVSGNNIANNDYGISLSYSTNNSIVGNNISYNSDGINGWFSFNAIVNNNILSNHNGIILAQGNNIIAGNIISKSYNAGIYFAKAAPPATNNIVAGNTIINNFIGLIFDGASDNMLYHNNIINSTQLDVWVPSPSFNVWDSGYPSGGNYWGNYYGIDFYSGSNQNETGSDGIGDTPYVINADNQDRYPLMHPWSPLPVHNINTGLGYASIQEAINANETLNGYTIFVEAGIYYENVVVNKTLSLIGENRETTIIDGKRTGIVVLVTASNVTVSGFAIKNAEVGMRIESDGNKIENNAITDNGCGISIFFSKDNTLRDDNLTGNILNFGVEGYSLTDFIHNIDSTNTVNGKPIHYLINKSDFIIDGSAFSEIGYLAVINSTNVTVSRLHLSKNVQGVLFAYTNNSIIRDMNISENSVGIYLVNSQNNSIYNNVVTANYRGFYIEHSNNNTIYHNNVIQNLLAQVISFYSTNTWDNSYPSGGNYWSNYTCVDLHSGSDQDETGSDGIGDTAHEIDVDSRDRYPLMGPFNLFDAGTWNGTAYNVDAISNSTVSNFQVDAVQKTISFNVTGSEFTTGFCRVTIPNLIVQELWQGNFTVLLNGEPCPFRNWTDTGNTYIYINYTYSEHQIIIIPEFPSAIVFPLFMIFTLVAFVLRKKRGMGHHKRGG